MSQNPSRQTDPQGEKQPASQSDKWAPWWAYLIVLLGANYIRAYLVPGDTFPTIVTVAIAVGQAAVLFVIVTAIWRLTRRSS